MGFQRLDQEWGSIYLLHIGWVVNHPLDNMFQWDIELQRYLHSLDNMFLRGKEYKKNFLP